MSVHSNHYDNEEEYERDLAWEYRDSRKPNPKCCPYEPEPYEPTCDDCEYCKTGLTFTYDIIDLWTKEEPTKDTPGNRCTLHKDLNRQGYVNLCVRDIDNIKEIHTWSKVCDDHGELFIPD